jgi:hypothetical protein
MIERTHERFGLWPERLAADAGYGDAPNLTWLVHERDVRPHFPVFGKSARRNGTFERSAFTYDHQDDSYVCPADGPKAVDLDVLGKPYRKAELLDRVRRGLNKGGVTANRRHASEYGPAEE